MECLTGDKIGLPIRGEVVLVEHQDIFNMRAVPISANPLQLDLRSHKRCLTICFFLTIGTFQYGLDYALVGGFLSSVYSCPLSWLF